MFHLSSVEKPVAPVSSRKAKARPGIEPSLDLAAIQFTPLEITARTRKQELVDAYKELLERYEQERSEEPAAKVVAQRKERDDIVRRSAQWTVDGVIDSLGTLKFGINSALDEVSRKMIDQTKHLQELGEAIDIQTARLKEIHDIEIAADSLATLIEHHREEEADFVQRLSAQEQSFKENFEIAKQDVQRQIAEAQTTWDLREQELERTRRREQEEHDYTTAQQRQRESDAFEAQKAALEKDLAEKREAQERDFSEREGRIKQQEEEFLRLQREVESFPSKLEKAVKEAEQSVRRNAERDAQTNAELNKRLVDGQQKLMELQIQNLQTKVADQAARISDLTRQLSEASAKVENIATKAIEGASNKTALTAVSDIALQQAGKSPAN